MKLVNVIKKGDIIREKWPQKLDEYISLYLGSGKMGGCFDEYGLMNNSATEKTKERPGNTFIMHADHWDGSGDQQKWIPLLRLSWLNGYSHGVPEQYKQELNLFKGQLNTMLYSRSFQLKTKVFFNPYCRDLMGFNTYFKTAGEDRMDPIMIAADVTSEVDSETVISPNIELLMSTNDKWCCRVRLGTADSVITLKVLSAEGDLKIKSVINGAEIHFGGKEGHFQFIIGCSKYEDREQLYAQMNRFNSGNSFEQDAVTGWEKRWGDAYIEIPVPELQAFWARSLYYILCSYGPDVGCPAPPGGWSGNGWPYAFPQDLSFIHPALLRLGHFDIAKAWVEFFFNMIDGVKRFTSETFQCEGTMWVWEFPIGNNWERFPEGVPNHYHYEIHNAAYPARMARETALFINEPEWTRKIAWPIVCESARFYASVLKKEEDGTWGIHLIPSMGQDEYGGQNRKNYLCSLFSAQYSLSSAVEMAEQLDIKGSEIIRWREILKDGLAYKGLHSEKTGLLKTYEDQEIYEKLCKQKHPVQLNPIVFLPLGAKTDMLVHAYKMRYSLCEGAERMMFHGWTLGAFLLASVHMGDIEGFKRGITEMIPSTNVSDDWLMFYESSRILGFGYLPYFTTSHGLFLQAMNDTMVHDYWGELQIESACPDEWDDIHYYNLRVKGGIALSGHRKLNIKTS